MRKIRLLIYLVFSCLALGCQQLEMPDLQPKEIPFRISCRGLGIDPSAKSVVSGAENGIDKVQLICFDNSSLYLGIREATISGDKLTGTVPEGTAQVHFVANANLNMPLSFFAGASSHVVMHSSELTVGKDSRITYWGFHKENTAEAMYTWLNPTSSTNYVYLIRDRARVQLSFKGDAKTKVDNGLAVQWMIHNGKSGGYIAPMGEDTSSGSDIWNNGAYLETSGTSYIAKQTLPLTENTDAERYSLYPDYAAVWETSEGSHKDFDAYNQSQFLFEDSNNKVGNEDNRLKVILKVPVSPSTTYPKGFKFLVALVKKDEVQLQIHRNFTYIIEVSNLEVDGYATLYDAINATTFANSTVEIDPVVADINDENGTMSITYVENGSVSTTAVVKNANQTVNVTFLYQPKAGTVSNSDFDIYWENERYTSWSIGSCSGSGNNFTVPVTIGSIPTSNNSIMEDYLVIQHKTSGLKRYMHIVAMKQFQLSNVSFVKDAGQLSENGSSYDVYKLTFTIPKEYPTDLYPIDIKFASSSLEPFSDASSSSRKGVYGVSVEDTSELGAGTTGEWNQGGNTWGYWYLYSIATPSYDGSGQLVDKTVSIYFKDIRSAKASGPSNVGLYMKVSRQNVSDFGGITSYSL